MKQVLATTDEPAYLPDRNASGFVAVEVDPRRYDGQMEDRDEVAGLVAELVPVGARVLDVGCGTGSLTQIVARARAATLVGIEPDPIRAQIARDRGIDARNGILTSGMLAKLGMFDVVLFADVLEHLPNPQEMLLMVRNALLPGGAVVASIPNVAHWTVRWDLLRGRFDYQSCGIMDATHLRWFTSDNVTHLFGSAGYRIVEMRHTAGTTLPDYGRRLPWRRLRPRVRNFLIRRSARLWPRLFGCQHVVRASLNGEGG
jgi:methionine biosynthesis protein MetW